MTKQKRTEGKKTLRQYWKILCVILIPLILTVTIIILQKPRQFTLADVSYSLSWQTLTPGGAFADEGLWIKTGWDGPTGEFSHGEIYGIKFGNKMLRLDIVDDPIAAIKKRLPNTIPSLLELFASQNHLERKCAGEALIKLGPAAHEALPVLLKRYGKGDEESDWVILKLSKAADVNAVAPLSEALKELNPKIRQKAAEALGEIGPGAENSEADLAKTLHDPDPSVIVASAVALRKISGKNHGEVQALTELLTNKDKQIRAEAIFTLGEFGESTEPSVPALLNLLEDGPPEHTGILIRTLGLIGPAARPAIPQIIKFLETNDHQVLMFSMEALGRFGEEAREAIPKLLELANEPEQMWGAISALSSMGTDAMPGLIELYRNGKNGQSFWAAKAFMKQGPKAAAAVPVLIESLRAGKIALAAQTLGCIGEPAKSATPHLLELIDDENSQVRIRVAEALWKIDRQTNVVLPVMLDELNDWSKEPNALISLSGDGNNQSRQQSRQQVAAKILGEIGPVAKEAVPLLQMMSRSSFDSQREAAEKALEQIGKETN